MRLIPLLILLLGLSGCSIFGGDDGKEPMELVDFEPRVELERVWKRSIGSGQGKGFTRLTPVIVDDMIYAAGHKGELVALDRHSGKRQWKRDLDVRLAGGVGHGDGRLLLGTDDGELLVLNDEGGEILWRAELPGEIMSVPAADSNVVAVQTLNGSLSVFDAESGESLWSYQSPPPKLTLRGRPSPVIAPSAIYAGFANGRAMAFNPKNGLILWEQRVSLPRGRSDLEKMVDIQATPLLDDGILYVSGYQGRLMAIGRSNGRPLWNIDSSSYQELGLSGDTLLLSNTDGAAIAYKTGSGTEIWRNEKMLRRQLTGPKPLGDYAVVADFDGYLHAMDLSNGQFAGRTRVDGSGVRAPLLSDGETLYAYANDGTLGAYKIVEP